MGYRSIKLAFSGERLQELRERRGWTQYDLAKRCSVSHTTVGRWESGENKPGARQLPLLEAAFELKVDEFLEPTQPEAK